MANATAETHQSPRVPNGATALMAAGSSESSKRIGGKNVVDTEKQHQQRPMTAIGIMSLGGRCQQTIPSSEELEDEEESSTGILTTDETDFSSASTSTTSSKGSTSSSHDENVVLARKSQSQSVPTTISERSGCLKVPTQKMSLALNYGKNHHLQASSSSSTKSLSWNTIEIFTHEVILGDNPSVTAGPPLSIGWEVWDKVCLTLEEYEAFRPERRSAWGLRMSRSERERLLLQEFGVTRSHMREVTELIQRIQRHRIASAKKTLPEALRDCFNSRRSVLRRNVQEQP